MGYESAKVRIPIPFMRQGRQVRVRAGDGVKAVTNAVGIEQCGGCKDRQRKWNQLLAFYGTRKR